MMIAGIDTFTAVTAILSFGVRSFSDLRCGALVLRYIGIEVIAATPRTFMLAAVLSHNVMKAGGPAGAKCAAPASNMSLTTDGPPRRMYSATSFSPIFWASCSTSFFSSITTSGRKPTPPAPLGIFTTSTSARAGTDSARAHRMSTMRRINNLPARSLCACRQYRYQTAVVRVKTAACGAAMRLPTLRLKHAGRVGWAGLSRSVSAVMMSAGRTSMNKLLPTTLVGSYAQPDWLIDREKLAGRFPPRVRAKELWRVAPEFLEAAQDDATLLAIRAQERAGLDIITDGEMRRESYSNRFATALEGVDLDNPGVALDRTGHENPVPRVVGAIRRRGPIEVRDVEFLRSITERRIKITVPGPFTMTQQAENDHYSDDRSLALAYAEAVNEELRDLKAAGADVVQIDEPYLQARPEPAKEYAIDAINRALDGIEGETVLHTCFGYAHIVHDRPSGYLFLAELANCAASQLSLEAAQPNLDPEALRAFGDKTVVLGVLDLGAVEVETPQVVADRIRKALAVVGPEKLVVAPDCGMKYLPRDRAFRKLQAMVEGARIVGEDLS